LRGGLWYHSGAYSLVARLSGPGVAGYGRGAGAGPSARAPLYSGGGASPFRPAASIAPRAPGGPGAGGGRAGAMCGAWLRAVWGLGPGSAGGGRRGGGRGGGGGSPGPVRGSRV